MGARLSPVPGMSASGRNQNNKCRRLNKLRYDPQKRSPRLLAEKLSVCWGLSRTGAVHDYIVRPTKMAIATGKIEPHWNYLLALERDLTRISRFVEFHPDNFGCFSIEIARVLLAAAAEADVVAKQICQTVNPQSSAETINAYRDQLNAAYPKIATFTVELPRFGLTLHPWDEWNAPNGVPRWWTAYNKTKHERHTEYRQANLKNALYAVAGLFVLVLYHYKSKAESGELVPVPELMRPGVDYVGGATDTGYDRGLNYRL